MATTMRKTIKIVFLITICITLAMVAALTSVTLILDNKHVKQTDNAGDTVKKPHLALPSKRVSRFLAQTDKPGSARNPNAAIHCNKDNEICNTLAAYGKNSTCCNNKCMDLSEDDKNCGACKNKCKFTQHCCRGQCVDLSYDARFCGSCYNKCSPGQYCIFGLCDYA